MNVAQFAENDSVTINIKFNTYVYSSVRQHNKQSKRQTGKEK